MRGSYHFSLLPDGFAQNLNLIPEIAAAHAFVVAGTLTILGLPAPDGTLIGVYSDVGGLVATALTSGGAGAFTTTVSSNSTVYFTSYTDSILTAGRSVEHVVGTPFNITIGGAATPTPPTLSNLTPANGTPIGPNDAIQFDLTDLQGFIIIIPMITLNANTVPEPTARGVLDADFAFEPLYQLGGSRRVPITNGYRYTLRRKGGWTSSPKLRLWAVDPNGAVWIGP